jgi:hypothetical protein
MNDEPSIFSRYVEGAPEKELQQPVVIKPRKAIPRMVDPKNFIRDVLLNGPVPTKNVLARGAERGLTRKQIWRAREQLEIIAFKEIGPRGPWFLALPHHQQ